MNDYSRMKQEFDSSICKKEGIKFPNSGTQKSRMLEYFWKNKGKLVTKQEVQKHFATKFNIHSDIQSVRHLGKQDGFAVLQYGNEWNGRSLKKGEYVFEGFNKVNHFYNKSRRIESSLDFESKKREYKNSCASCGAKENTLHKWTNEKVVLEKGHMDPSKEMTDDNIIPQCNWCNKIAKNKWIFDRFGFPKYMTIDGLLSHNDQQLREFYNILKDKFEND
jgi:hypothetical protein